MHLTVTTTLHSAHLDVAFTFQHHLHLKSPAATPGLLHSLASLTHLSPSPVTHSAKTLLM
ncbi:hypothetical protein E2C01_062641 [Portunus trituberculatus]|uniref:Uncharacterized protein n=1 Tax=Portunus trituberculatus TaxID=210409 RepID=A0A5B7HF80_PORTR|nr:hypothetical protein [Portunus trituberculatus]